MRANGAVAGGAAGFESGDSVIVMKKRDNSKVYVIGHADGIKVCKDEPLPPPAGSWRFTFSIYHIQNLTIDANNWNVGEDVSSTHISTDSYMGDAQGDGYCDKNGAGDVTAVLRVSEENPLYGEVFRGTNYQAVAQMAFNRFVEVTPPPLEPDPHPFERMYRYNYLPQTECVSYGGIWINNQCADGYFESSAIWKNGPRVLEVHDPFPL